MNIVLRHVATDYVADDENEMGQNPLSLCHSQFKIEVQLSRGLELLLGGFVIKIWVSDFVRGPPDEVYNCMQPFMSTHKHLQTPTNIREHLMNIHEHLQIFANTV